jgi:NADH-quinone oxidoreductase subunit D
MAIEYGITGPNLRASGVAYDVRKANPYCGYEKYEFNVPVGTDGEHSVLGDCWNRYYVRIEEMRESAKIIRQALDGLPAGKAKADLKKVKPSKGEAYTSVENPRGELGFYIVSDGSDVALRCRARAPSFANLSVLSEMVRGVLIADLIAILGSLDIVLGEIDR